MGGMEMEQLKLGTRRWLKGKAYVAVFDPVFGGCNRCAFVHTDIRSPECRVMSYPDDCTLCEFGEVDRRIIWIELVDQ